MTTLQDFQPHFERALSERGLQFHSEDLYAIPLAGWIVSRPRAGGGWVSGTQHLDALEQNLNLMDELHLPRYADFLAMVWVWALDDEEVPTQ